MPDVYLVTGTRFRALDAGVALPGAKVYTYEPGTLTPKTTYSDPDGTTANANPIICDSDGDCDLWVTAATRIIVHTADDVLVSDTDNVRGIGIPQSAAATSEWTVTGITPTYLTSTTFRVSGDQRATFQDDRRVRATGTPTGYTSVLSTVYDGGGDTTTITVRDAVIPSDITAADVGFVTADDSGIDVRGLAGSTELASVVNNFAATTDPGASNDDSQNYSKGSVWMNTTAGRIFMCRDASTGAAVWDRLSVLSPGNAAGIMSGAGYPDKDVDSADGAEKGTLYISTDHNDVSICVDPAAGAAVWHHLEAPDAVAHHSTSADGGDATSGSWGTIPGSQKRNNIGGATISAFGFTLPAGRYRCEVRHVFFRCSKVKLRIYNDTDTAAIDEGITVEVGASESVTLQAFADAEFTLTAAKIVRGQYQCDTTRATDGLGRAPSFGGTQTYGEIRFRRLGNA